MEGLLFPLFPAGAIPAHLQELPVYPTLRGSPEVTWPRLKLHRDEKRAFVLLPQGLQDWAPAVQSLIRTETHPEPEEGSCHPHLPQDITQSSEKAFRAACDQPCFTDKAGGLSDRHWLAQCHTGGKKQLSGPVQTKNLCP